MEEVTSFYKLQVSPRDYYLEDLFEIYQLFKSDTVYIKTERYEFDSFEELRQYDGLIKRLYISIPQPFINVEIDQCVTISSNKNTPFARDIIDQIGALIEDKMKTRKMKFSINNKFTFLFVISALLLILLKDQQIMNLEFAISGFLLITLFYFSTRKSSVKLLQKKFILIN